MTEPDRLAENKLFLAWEAGFKAGLTVSQNPDARPINPHQYHRLEAKT